MPEICIITYMWNINKSALSCYQSYSSYVSSKDFIVDQVIPGLCPENLWIQSLAKQSTYVQCHDVVSLSKYRPVIEFF